MSVFNGISGRGGTINGTPGRDSAFGGSLFVEEVRSPAVNHTRSDFFERGAFNETYDFGAGDDRVGAGSGNDSYLGGDGFDVISVTARPYAVLSNFEESEQGYQANVNLAAETASFDGNSFSWIRNNRLLDEDFKPIGFVTYTWSNPAYGAYRHTVKDFEGIIGSDGNDVLAGSAAPIEAINPRGGNDTVTGGDGEDWLSYVDSNEVIASLETGLADERHFYQGADRAGKDTFIGFENLAGGFGSDKLTGDDKTNVFFGGAGNDTIDGGSDGVNTVIYDVTEMSDGLGMVLLGNVFGELPNAVLTRAIKADMAAGTVEDQFGGQDTLINIINLIASRGDDEVVGDGFANRLDGLAGKDSLDGGGGDDTLDGGEDVDMLTGGDGADRFVIKADLLKITEETDIDIVTDFTFGEDSLLFL